MDLKKNPFKAAYNKTWIKPEKLEFLFSKLSSPWFFLIVLSLVSADIASLYMTKFIFPENLAKPSTSVFKMPDPTRISFAKDNAFVLSDQPLLTLLEIERGKKGSPSQEDQVSLEELLAQAEPSSLPLTLTGNIVHTNPAISVASISNSSGEVLAFKVSEKVFNLAEILKIDRSRVYFRNLSSEKVEYIFLGKDKPKIKEEVKKTAKSPKASRFGFVKKDDKNYEIPADKLKKHITNLRSILNQAQVVPEMSGGNLDGFRFTYIEQGGFFDSIGLQENDVITMVNGQKIEGPEQASEIYANMQNNVLSRGQPVRITIKRGGKTQTINYRSK